MKLTVQKNERAVLLKDKAFEAILAPGEHTRLGLFSKYRFQIFDMEKLHFDSPLADYLYRYESDVVNTHFHVVDVKDEEVTLRYESGSLVEILPPGTRKLFWKWGAPLTFETVNLAETYQVSRKLLAYLAQPALRGKAVSGLQSILTVVVPDSFVGLLRVDGKLVAQLSPGKTAYWRFNRDIQAELIDTRLQVLEVSGQEILTRDKVNLRININAHWQYDDVSLAFARLAKPADHIYRELQFAVRAAVGTRSLDELLEDKQVIDQVVNQHLKEKLNDFGISICSVGVKDIVLPGEMKTLLTRVVEAEKAAQANVIRRREETNATRSMLNTAKVMESNPVALRLKELETLERVAERIDKISVFGGLDQVLNGLVSIKN